MPYFRVRTRQEMGLPALNWWQVCQVYGVPKLGTGGQRGNSIILPRSEVEFVFKLNARYNSDSGLLRWLVNTKDSIYLRDDGKRPPDAIDELKWPMIAIGNNPVFGVERVNGSGGVWFWRIMGLSPEGVVVVDRVDLLSESRLWAHIIYGGTPPQKTPHGLGIMPLFDPRFYRYTGGAAAGLFIEEAWLEPIENLDWLEKIEPVDQLPEPHPETKQYQSYEQIILRKEPGGERKGTLPAGAMFTVGEVQAVGKNIWGVINGRWWGALKLKGFFTSTWRPG